MLFAALLLTKKFSTLLDIWQLFSAYSLHSASEDFGSEGIMSLNLLDFWTALQLGICWMQMNWCRPALSLLAYFFATFKT